ncbi:MAG: NADP-dependent oxidoreductase [Solirubrobacteraceae bacterium]
MRAMAIREFGGSDRVELMDLPEPKVGPDTVRIAVKAAGLNPVDCKVREGNLEAAFPHHFPLILGWDAAGTVDAVGPAVVGLQEGDEVYAYCRKTEICEGTYAELVSMPAGAVARKPGAASWAQAGGTPLAGLTAWQVLVEALEIGEDETVAIGAAAGGVGHLAVQIAVARGAEVIGIASEANHDFVRSLGADHVIDYRRDDVSDALHELHAEGIDAAFDLYGGEALEALRTAVRPGGRIASIAQPGPEGDRADLNGRYVFVRPSARGLAELAALADAGRLRVEVAQEYPLEDAAAAQDRLSENHVRGKLVLTI